MRSLLYNSAYKILLNNEDVADCLQETEIRTWQKIPNIKNEAAFNSWIFRIMVNIAKDILKKRGELVEFEDSYIGGTESNYEQSDLEEEFNKLPERYKISIILHYYAGFNINEISEQLNLSKNTFKTRLARGRVKLKILLEGVENDYKKEDYYYTRTGNSQRSTGKISSESRKYFKQQKRNSKLNTKNK